ncbi:hypothetical protein OGAPHI_002316 [Ogataea philodendri]|uniref:Uncharacterized protein n=1 Tax=Ogataea philodendri TaxID=1378263 RepID=A0A9P8PC35_9ASCO|nr:uncharacterized protein OGAPHI_002316 [Ogataea philodendri]KAH3668562.1 hypothetical protein OGAPHI_002316 [Ogataea philodendri]
MDKLSGRFSFAENPLPIPDPLSTDGEDAAVEVEGLGVNALRCVSDGDLRIFSAVLLKKRDILFSIVPIREAVVDEDTERCKEEWEAVSCGRSWLLRTLLNSTLDTVFCCKKEDVESLPNA